MRKTWQDRLKPFAEEWLALEARLNQAVAGMTADELTKLSRACQRVSQTNCWYAAYFAAPAVLSAVRRRQYVNRLQKGEDTKAALRPEVGNTNLSTAPVSLAVAGANRNEKDTWQGKQRAKSSSHLNGGPSLRPSGLSPRTSSVTGRHPIRPLGFTPT